MYALFATQMSNRQVQALAADGGKGLYLPDE